MTLPAALATAITAFVDGLPGARLQQRAEAMSAAYRAFRPSQGPIAASEDVAAYLLTRLPATHAALDHVFAELVELAPGLEPRTMLDLGCGPGTASWAAAEHFSSIEAARLVDRSGPFLDAARRLAGEAGFTAECVSGDLRRPPAGSADLVVLGYALTELDESGHEETVAAAWAATKQALVIVEPGRPRDHQRLMTARTALIGQGAAILAPCPHHAACPLVAPDWCHFSVRLERSRAHRRLKQAALGYEDEKFSYLIALRDAPATETREPRVLAPPEESKFDIAIKACRPDGTAATSRVLKRDREAFHAVRKLRWGDRWPI
jgi:ribosomal protein RSM22 (predicted rRNA methylase)